MNVMETTYTRLPMSTPILTTKLYIPTSRSDFVPRLRLIEKLNIGLSHKLTLISAPAGFGKSTLLSSWVAQIESSQVTWLSLDEGDNDLARFLTYFVAALQTIEPTLGEGVLTALQSPGTPNSELVLTTLINEIAGFPKDLVLILDDYHVIESQPINQAITFLLDHLPANLHLVIATRIDPPLPLARLRARGEMTELRTTNLRFTNDEVTEFLNQVMDLRLSVENIAALETRTEGWIVGLQLAALSLQDREDSTEFIQSFTGSHHHILDYLVEEVLTKQSSDTQSFLLQTSILERLTGSLCDVVRFGLPETQSSSEGTAPTRQQNGQVMLDKLSQSNLFIIPLDDERQWYRYHHLFADLLRHRLTQTHPEQISDLHNRASKWLEKNGFIKQAIIHALNLDEKYRAADLIERYSKNFFYQGVAQIDELLAWFNLLPDKLIQERPLLHIFLARALAFKSPFQNKDTINRILDQTQLLLNNKDWGKTIEDLVAGHIASLRGLMSSPPIQPDHDPDMVLALFQEALRLLPPDEARLRSGIYNVIAYEYMHLGDIEPALRASQTAKSEARKVNNNISAIIALRNQAVIAYHQGELAQAIDICQNGLISFSQNSTGKVPLIPGLEALFTALGYMYVECGELEKAEIELKTGFEMLRLANEYEAVLIGHVALIRMLLMKNETEQARQICKQLKTEWPGFVKLAETLQVQVELSYIESNTITLEKITGWLIENRFIIEASVDIQGITPWAEMQHISVLTWIKGQITLSRHNPESHNYHSLQMCLDYLEKQCHSSEEHGLVFRVIECNVYKTIVLEALGENYQAMACLEQALKLAEPRGYVRVFVETGKPIERLLSEASDHGISPIYVQKLLTAFEIKYQPDLIASPIDAGDLRTIGFNSQTASPVMEPLTDRELEVLHLMAEGLTYNEIAGQIMVSLNTVRTHIKNIYSKLFVHKRSQAIAKAKELNIL